LNLDITEWLEWFFSCLERTIDNVENTLQKVNRKANFWKSAAGIELNSRQRLMLNKLLDGFEGKLNTSKWAKITKASPDTSLRDITDLINKGILVKDVSGGGVRVTS